AWLTIEDAALRSTSIATLGARIVSGIEKVAGRALDLTSHGEGDYAKTLNTREFATPGTVGAAKSRTALNWISDVLTNLPSDLLRALGAKVNALMALMARSIKFRQLKREEIQALLKIGENVERSA